MKASKPQIADKLDKIVPEYFMRKYCFIPLEHN